MKLVSTLSNPMPERAFVGSLKTPDGVLLRFARFAPPPGRKGTLCIFPGRSEFIEKYFEVVREAQARGFAVALLDWRGQGLSERLLSDPLKGHVGSFSQYDTDIEAFMKEVVLPDCPPPLFAVAHSMGAAILIRAAHRGRRWFDRVVLSSPMIDLPWPGLPHFAKPSVQILNAMGLRRLYVPRGSARPVTSFPFLGNILTSDPVRYARTAEIVETEPALALASPTVGWLHAAVKAMAEFAEPTYPNKIRQPILIIAAGQDQVVSTPATEQFAVRLRNGTHLIVPGARHELLMEQDRYREPVWAAFDAFVPGTPVFA
jgi:lysophospholipase